MKKQENKFLNRIIGIVLSLIIYFFVYFFIKGFVELIENQTEGVVIFYGMTAIFILWKLGDLLKVSLEMIFNKE